MRKSIISEALLVYTQTLSLKTHRSVFSSVASAIFETFTVRVLQRVFSCLFAKRSFSLVIALINVFKFAEKYDLSYNNIYDKRL